MFYLKWTPSELATLRAGALYTEVDEDGWVQRELGIGDDGLITHQLVPTAANTTGAGEALAELAGTRLTLRGDFSGLKGAATVARLHQGPVMGVRGPAIADVAVPAATNGTFSAEVTLTAAQAEGLRQGQVYLQIHSETAPDGNLWGWLLP
jgi:hypothetical protein